MPPKTPALRPQEAVDIDDTISAGIAYMGAWTRLHTLVESMSEDVEWLDNPEIMLATMELKNALRRNPPQKALEILNMLPELFATMDQIDAGRKASN